MTYERVAPQVVRNPDGWTVQIGSRYHIEYLEDDRLAKINADVESVFVRLYGQSVQWVGPDIRLATAEERDLILARVGAGLWAMSIRSEVIDE